MGQMIAMANLCQANLYVLKEAVDRVEGHEEMKMATAAAKAAADEVGAILCTENSRRR